MIFPGDFFLTRSQQAMAKQLIMKITQPTMQNIIAEPVCAHLWLKSLKYDDKGMLFKWSTDEIYVILQVKWNQNHPYLDKHINPRIGERITNATIPVVTSNCIKRILQTFLTNLIRMLLSEKEDPNPAGKDSTSGSSPSFPIFLVICNCLLFQ